MAESTTRRPRWTAHLAATGPRRLRVGLLLLTSLLLVCSLGPRWGADPSTILDPRVAGLLPPGSSRIVVERRDGSTLAAESVRREGNVVVALRGGAEERLPAGDIVAIRATSYWLGTDTLGRDVLARLLHGGRVSLAVGGLALFVAVFIGVAVGMAAGLAGRTIDAVLMRLVDALLAVPMLFLLILLAALFRPSVFTLVAVLGFSSWMGVARLVRGQVLSLKSRDFVLGARAVGSGPLRIAFIHLLPNVAAPLAQDAALRLGDLILVEAALSFLGLGVQPPLASWGGMVAQGEELVMGGWWVSLFPGACIAATVIAAALIADGLGDLARAQRHA
jgi:peptide/nickel transport system permease protein